MLVPSRIPLSLRLPIFAAGLMILLGIVASQMVLTTLSRVQDARLRELADLHVESLSVALGPLVLREDIWGVYDTLRRASGEAEGQRMVFTAVSGPDRRIIAATDPRRAPLDAPLPAEYDRAQTAENLSVSGEAPLLVLTAPLVHEGRVLGDIFTELDVTDLIEQRRVARRFLLVGNALATAVLALFGYVAMRRMLRPIDRLAQRMRDTAKAPEPFADSDMPRGDTELSRLMKTYNALAAAVTANADTERRLAERERFVSLGRLSSSLAHEINNPLGGLLNATDTIRKYADRPEVVRQSASLLTRGLEHMRDVVRATLDQNRLDRSGAPLTREDFDDLQLLVGPEIKSRRQSLDWTVEADDSTMTGLASAPIRQIALNLLLNATSAAGVGGKVGLRLEKRPGGMALEIRDSGAGLSPDARMRLLSSDPVQPGGGVGLRLVHDLVEELDGTLDVARKDAMTIITVRLPVPALQEVVAAC